MSQLNANNSILIPAYRAFFGLCAWLLSALLPGTSAWANADGPYTGDYEYGGEAIHLYVELDQRGPETLKLRRLLSREHRIDPNDYILLAVIVDNLNATTSGFARLSVGGHKGQNIQTTQFQTRLLAPADERRDWKLYLSRDAHINGFTAILAPRAYSNYRGIDYGYYDQGYLNNSTFYGWIWRDRHYQHPRGHRYYNHRHYDRYFGRQYDPRYDRRYNRSRDGHYRSHRDNRGYRKGRDGHNDHRQAPDQTTNQTQRPARPGFGDRDIYDHERTQRPNRDSSSPRSSTGIRDQRLRRNHEYRAERRSNRERINPGRQAPSTATLRTATPRAERLRAQQRQQSRQPPHQQQRQQQRRQQQRQQIRQQQRSQAAQARVQRRPQLNKQPATQRRQQTRPRNER